MLHYGEAQAGAAHLAGTSLIHAVEALEDAREILGRNAHAGIGDGNFDAAFGHLATSQPHFTVFAIELDGVVQKVQQGLFESNSVAENIDVGYGPGG